MKFGISVSTFPTEKRPATFGDGRPARHLAGLRELGYHGVDLFIKPLPEPELSLLKQALDEAGMEVSVIFPVMLFEEGWCLSDPDPERRREAVRLYNTQTDLAAFLGAKNVLGLDRGRPRSGEPESVFEARLAESLNALADYAGRKGVEIVFEPVHRFLPAAFQRVEQCLEFFDRYRLDSLQLLLDTFHMNIEERSIEGAVRLAAGRIGHVHAVENNRGAPGEGHLNFGSIIGALLDTGYDGYLSVETEPRKDPQGAARQGISVLQDTLRRICAPGEPDERA